MTDYQTIRVSSQNHVGTIVLDRPKALNALNAEAMAEVVAAAEAFDADEEIRAIVLTGSPKAFAAGADISEMAELEYADTVTGGLFDGWSRFTAVRTPVIAAVAGYALGGGCELAMMCDIVIAAETAVFGQPEIKLGVIPGMGGTQRLIRAVGKAKAMELILTGRSMPAREAEAAGLVARVVPADELDAQARAMAEAIAKGSLPVLYAAKQAVNQAYETDLASGLRFEREAFRGTFALRDRSEGMAAFLQKRPPRFTGR